MRTSGSSPQGLTSRNTFETFSKLMVEAVDYQQRGTGHFMWGGSHMVFRGFQREDQSSPIDNIFETIALWLPRTANKDRGRGKLIRILQSK